MSTNVGQKSLNAQAWEYRNNNKKETLNLVNRFSCNDIETNLKACIADEGIGRFTQLAVREAPKNKLLCPILEAYDWGTYNLYIMYQQKNLPKRTRLLLDFIYENRPR